mgnify:CR=1 FL=1|tara:strand:+ start:72 stop:464 length:393 start_codon:yes stop_codon:yes gene_type:complete
MYKEFIDRLEKIKIEFSLISEVKSFTKKLAQWGDDYHTRALSILDISDIEDRLKRLQAGVKEFSAMTKDLKKAQEIGGNMLKELEREAKSLGVSVKDIKEYTDLKTQLGYLKGSMTKVVSELKIAKKLIK